MTKEDKELLLRDLCCRLPYGLYATVRDPKEKDDFQPFEVLGIKEDLVWVKNTMIGIDHFDTIEVVKPYLRPISSMTNEEQYICRIKRGADLAGGVGNESDYLNSIHVDYRGLIEKGLALEAPEGMYDIKD